jgi:outer membrane murein-binding lipoprotein Lpp
VVTITAPSLVEATGPSGAVVAFTATATDAVSGSLTPICVPASGSTFPLGTTTITCSATDGAGNTGTAIATVVVEDKTAPTLNLPTNITAVATSASGAVVTYAVSATDPDNDTSTLTITCSPPSGSTFPAGVTTVTCTATDPAGNTITGTFQVAVVDFSMGRISPVTVPVGGAASTSVTVNSVSGFSSAVALSASGAPAGVSVSFNPTSVTPTSGGSAGSTLTVHLSPMVTPTTFTLTVTGTFEGVSHTSTASVTVTVSSPAIADVVSQLLLAGCIDNAGIANALTAKLTAEQGAISSGSTKTAINILSAFTDQARAQSGKHITADCATVLMTDARSLIDSLAVSATPNPITGSVRTASGSGVAGRFSH